MVEKKTTYFYTGFICWRQYALSETLHTLYRHYLHSLDVLLVFVVGIKLNFDRC